jgi:hypothetical protein
MAVVGAASAFIASDYTGSGLEAQPIRPADPVEANFRSNHGGTAVELQVPLLFSYMFGTSP